MFLNGILYSPQVIGKQADNKQTTSDPKLCCQRKYSINAHNCSQYIIVSGKRNLNCFNMLQGCKRICLGTLKLHPEIQTRCMSALSKTEERKHRNNLFDEEKKKQRAAIGRIEKMEVKYQSAIDEVILLMNKDLSTPHDCARHISEGVAKYAALAVVNGQPWDMHRPLPDACTLEFVMLNNPRIRMVNSAFWRTCSFMLGAVVDTAFKSNIEIFLHSFPAPNIHTGSFVHDVSLNLPEWQPTNSELKALSAAFIKLATQELPVEWLQTTKEVALDMFQENPFKTEQIPNIAENNENIVTMYRIGDHVDISKGPMVGNTFLMGRTSITAIHKVPSETMANLYRFQGVAIPKGLILNHFAYTILEDRAKKLNDAKWIPHDIVSDRDSNIVMTAKN